MPVAMEMEIGDPAEAGRLRAGNDDRERVTNLLQTAFTQGRLTGEELDARTDQALAARTYAELNALTEDLPGIPRLAPAGSLVPGQAASAPQPAPVRYWRLARGAAISAGCVGLALVLAISGNLIDNSWDGPGPGPHHGWTRLLLLLAVAALFASIVVLGRAVVTTLEERNARRQQLKHPAA
jgi:DUF1707 SHOCT-like domain